MSKISIDLDLAVVQKALHAKVQPAVDKILEKYDLPKMIAAELERKEPPRGGGFMYYLDDGSGGEVGRPFIEKLITGAIREAAEAYVKKWVKRERPNIEAAFEEMLRGSANKLARTLIGVIDEAVRNGDWGFELKTTAKAKEPDRTWD